MQTILLSEMLLLYSTNALNTCFYLDKMELTMKYLFLSSLSILIGAIKYLCSADKIIALNMCEYYNVNFNDTVLLILDDKTQSFKECQCWVNKGAFRLMIMDLRLNMRNTDQCSKTKLFINEHHYSCDPKSDSYGAVFGEIVKLRDGLPPDVMIALVSGSGTPPEMVLIELIPKGISRLVCYGDRKPSLKTTELAQVPTTQTQLISSTSDSKRPRVTTGYNDILPLYESSMDDGIVKTERILPIALIFIVLAVAIIGLSPNITEQWGTTLNLPHNYGDIDGIR